MVNFHDPSVITKDLMAVNSLYPIICGIYIWEFLTSLDYEINIIRRCRPYGWTIWIYSFVRITALVTVILSLVNAFPMAPINCQVWIIFQTLFGYLSLFAASLLIVIRIAAIWNKNGIAVAIASSVWMANVVVSIRGITQLRSGWNTTQLQCIVLNPESGRLNIIVLVITDIVLLFTMFVGLLRFRSNGGGRFGVGRLIWKQGMMWLLLATVAEFPPAILIILNLNGPLNFMFQLPSVITLSIAATRLYRSLSDFVSYTTDTAYDNPTRSSSNASTLKRSQATPIASNRIEVAIDTTHEQYSMSRNSHHDLYSTEEKSYDSHRPHSCEPQQQPGELV